MKPFYLITDGGRLRLQGRLLERIEQALIGAEGKIGHVQLREQLVANPNYPPASDEELIAIGGSLKILCDKHDAKLIISRRLDIAQKLGASGIHLGQTTANITQTRQSAPKSLVIGYSAHSANEAVEAISLGANYTFLSPIFPTPSKQTIAHHLGLEELRIACKNTTGTVFALGGINENNFRLCLDAGAQGVAIISALLETPDPQEAAKKFIGKLRCIKS